MLHIYKELLKIVYTDKLVAGTAAMVVVDYYGIGN